MNKTLHTGGTAATRTLLLAALLLMGLAACQDYGDDVRQIGSRVELLEHTLRQQDSTILALQTLVAAAEIDDYVTAVVEHDDGSVTISFQNAGDVTLYPGSEGTEGAGHAIGVKQDADGLYYWTVDGEWLLDSSGNKVRAGATDGQSGTDAESNTPRLRIVDGQWEVWNEATRQWEALGWAADGQNGLTDYIVAVVPGPYEGQLTIITKDGQEFVFKIVV